MSSLGIEVFERNLYVSEANTVLSRYCSRVFQILSTLQQKCPESSLSIVVLNAIVFVSLSNMNVFSSDIVGSTNGDFFTLDMISS